jgi:chemotaxis protein CheD
MSMSVPKVYLEAGDLFIASGPAMASTVLGSCVSVCLWDPVRRAGGMNHFVLPTAAAERAEPRYGDVAIDMLVQALHELGCRAADLRAKVFGGANVLGTAGADSVGLRNSRFALEHLERHGIPVSARKVGGDCGLYLKFSTEAGAVLVRALGR